MGKHADRLDMIKRLAAEGKTRREIATEMKACYNGICRTIRSNNIACVKRIDRGVPVYWEERKVFWTPERIAELDELRYNGLSWWQCGQALGAPTESCRVVGNRQGYYEKFGGRNE